MNQYSTEPRFVDQLAIDVVVLEHRYMKLTAAEKQHAAHGLAKQGLETQRIAEIMRVADRTVLRILKEDPPPTLDIDADGQYVDAEGEVVGNAVFCPLCDEFLYGQTGFCRKHYARNYEHTKARQCVSV